MVYSDSGFALEKINLHKSVSLTFEMFSLSTLCRYIILNVCVYACTQHFYAGPIEGVRSKGFLLL